MKRNKLYTVTKGNMQPLMRSVSNTFDWGGLAQADYQKNPWDYTQDYLYGNGPSIEEQYKNSKNSFGISKADNPFSKGNVGGTMMGLAGAIPDSPMTIGGTTYKRGLFDLADPIHHLAGGNESAVGNAMGDVGVGVFKAGATSGNPFLMIGGAALKALGSGVNALWGTQTNQEKLNAARQGTSRLANYTSNATDFSGVQAPDVVSNVQDPYRGGVFKKGWARRKNAALAEAREDAVDWANRSMDNNIANITNNRLNNALANYSAFGGPIGPIDSVIDNDNMGAIEYGFMSDYLTQKRQAAEARNKIAGITPMPAFLPNSFAIGGDIQMNGGDFSTGSVHIDEGKTHSENPNGGVQIGTDREGVPNLVEEGEVIFNDYVYSNRIQCDEATKNKFHIGKKRELSYADLAKKLEKEIQERPNDPISKAGFQAQMQQLADEQERQKQEMEEERAKEAFEALSPEEKVAVMQGVSARENLAAQEQQQVIAEQQAAMQAAATQQQPTVQPTPEEIAMAQQGQAPEVPVDAAMAQGQQEGVPVMAKGGDLKGRTLPEVVITPEVPVTPAPVVSSVTPLEVLGAMETLAQADREKKNEELLQEMAKEMEDNRRTKIHYYAPGGPVEGRDEEWYGNLRPEYRWLADTYGLKNQHDMLGMDSHFLNSLAKLYEFTQNRSQYRTLPINASFDDATIDDDIWTSLKNKGYDDVNFQDLTPEQWRDIYDDYMVGYNDFTSKYPYISYSDRMQPNVRRRWDTTYEGYIGEGSAVPTQTSISQGATTPPAIGLEDTSTPLADGDRDRLTLRDRINNLVDKITERSKARRDRRKARREERALSREERRRLRAEEKMQERQEKEELHRLRALEKAQRNANKQGRVGVQPGYLDEINNSIDTGTDDYYGNGQISSIPEVVITPPNVQPVQAPEMAGLPFPSGNTPQASVPPVPGLFEDPRTLPIIESPTQNNSNGLTEIKRSVGVVPGDLGAFQTRMETDFEGLNESKKNDSPRHRAEWLRYAGLFGPAAGLGMMAAGVGRPDYSRLDAAVAAGSGAPVTASYKPIGDYLTYNPLDVWSQQNALNAQARATDRAIQNQSSPSRMAGLLASGYNSQVASGNLFRQAQEYNDALRRQVAEFNRGTNQYNADAYTRNSQFNADALNRNRQFNAQLQMEAARQRADADAGWYNSLYGNVAGLFRGMGDIGTENYRMNRISDMAADGLFGVMGDSNLGRRALKNTRCNGGKMKKRGLTY